MPKSRPTMNVNLRHCAGGTPDWKDQYGLNWTSSLPGPGISVIIGGEWQACNLGEVFDIDSNGFWVVFQSPVRSGLLHYFWCNRTRTGLFFPAILGNRTKTGMDWLPTVTGETATGFRPVFIWTGPKPEVTGRNWPGSLTSKCLLMHPPRQHLLSTA